MQNEPIDIDKLIADAHKMLQSSSGLNEYEVRILKYSDALAQLKAERDAAVEKLNRLRFRAAMEVK